MQTLKEPDRQAQLVWLMLSILGAILAVVAWYGLFR
jgi:hypothetical protein